MVHLPLIGAAAPDMERSRLPFVFYCSQCGATLYQDSKPVLKDGTYRRENYLQSVITKVGGKCPHCGHELHNPPLKVEVVVTRSPSSDKTR